jgi:hypothetical protein
LLPRARKTVEEEEKQNEQKKKKKTKATKKMMRKKTDGRMRGRRKWKKRRFKKNNNIFLHSQPPSNIPFLKSFFSISPFVLLISSTTSHSDDPNLEINSFFIVEKMNQIEYGRCETVQTVVLCP